MFLHMLGTVPRAPPSGREIERAPVVAPATSVFDPGFPGFTNTAIDEIFGTSPDPAGPRRSPERRESSEMPERVDTVVIGAGQSGLAASYHLTERGREHVVLERGRVAETWRTQRWDGFALNTPNWAQQLPGFHYRGPEPDAFAPLPEVISYLEEYATSFGAPVREGFEVTRVRRRDGGFLVEAGGEPLLEARHVVVAAGAYQRPTPSPLARALPEEVTQLHTSEYRRPEQLPSGAVLVVGSGQSGCQISEELLAAGRRVYLSVGRCPWFPRRYRGRELVHWLLETGLAHDTVDTLPSPTARLTCNPTVSGNDGGHDCNPRWLARRGATLLGRVETIDGQVLRIGAGLEESLSDGDRFVAGFKQRVDELVRSRRLDVDDPEPETEHPPHAGPRRAPAERRGHRHGSLGERLPARPLLDRGTRDRRAGLAGARARRRGDARCLLRRSALAPHTQVGALPRRGRGRRARRREARQRFRAGVASLRSELERAVQTYAILRRHGWTTRNALGDAGDRSNDVREGELAGQMHWVRSYFFREDDGSLGTICIYESQSADAIREHATRAGLPADEVLPVFETVVARPDPPPVTTP